MSWIPKRLDQLGTISRGRSRHRPRDAAHLYGGPYPFIQTGDVKHAGLYLKDFTQTYSEAGLKQSKLWPVGTLCITIAANIADTSILDIEACFPDSVIGFIAEPEQADTRFIKYLFDAIYKKKYKQYTQGAAQDNLSQSKLLSEDFFVPAVADQRAIADVLSEYDNLIENNRRRIQLLEQAARLLYKEWFVHLRFPGHEHVPVNNGIPEGWKGNKVGDVVAFLARGITPRYDEDAEGIVLNQKCIRDQRVNPALARRQSKHVPVEKRVQSGDVLINSTGAGTLGRVAQLFEEIDSCTVDSHITIARPETGIPMFHFGQTLVAREEYLASMGKGSTNQTELSKDTIAELPYVLPTNHLVLQFEDFAGKIAKQAQNLITQNRHLTAARDLLLPRLMSGEITV